MVLIIKSFFLPKIFSFVFFKFFLHESKYNLFNFLHIIIISISPALLISKCSLYDPVNVTDIVAHLTKAVQQLSQEKADREQEITNLENRIEQIEQRLI